MAFDEMVVPHRLDSQTLNQAYDLYTLLSGYELFHEPQTDSSLLKAFLESFLSLSLKPQQAEG